MKLCAKDEQTMVATRLLRHAFELAYLIIFSGCNIKGIIEAGAGNNRAESDNDEAIIPLDMYLGCAYDQVT